MSNNKPIISLLSKLYLTFVLSLDTLIFKSYQTFIERINISFGYENDFSKYYFVTKQRAVEIELIKLSTINYEYMKN